MPAASSSGSAPALRGGAIRARVVAYAAWTLTLVVAAYLRLNNLKASVVGDEIAANGPDAAYHARRMLLTWADYPRVPSFDPLLDWPGGAVAPWPPGFDFLVATFARLSPDRFGALVLIALAPVVLGLVLVALVGPALRAIDPRAPWWTGWLAASLVAIFPQAVSVARFGNPDHHIAEALIMLGLGLWSLWGWRALAQGELDARRRVAFEAAGAGLTAFAVTAFIGTPAYVGIAGAVLALANVLWGRGPARRWALGAPALAAGAAIGALCFLPLVAGHGRTLSYVYPSLLQPLLVLAVALGCAGASALGSIAAAGPRARAIGLGAAAVVLAAALLVPDVRAAGVELLHGLHEWFADRASPLAQLTENQPLFTPLSPGDPFWSRAHLYYGVFGPLLPLLVPAGLIVLVRRSGLRAAFPFVWWTLCIALLMLQQNRFGRVGLVNLAICAALCLAALAQLRPRLAAVAAAVPALAFALDPAFHYYLAPAPSGALPGIQEAGVFLRDHAPAPIAGRRAGVVVPWDEAHFVVRYGRRPVTATGFGVYVAKDAIDEVARLWTGDEASLLRFAQRRDLGFVALSASAFTSRTLHGKGPMPRGTNGTRSLNVPYFARVPLATLLLAGSGIADARVAHLAHLMPRFASTAATAELPVFLPESWVYECVAGARVRGRAAPSSLVRLHTPLLLRGRRIVHEAWTQAGADGRFELITPLPTGYAGKNLQTGSRALLSTGGAQPVALVIAERAVRSGAIAHDGAADAVPANRAVVPER